MKTHMEIWKEQERKECDRQLADIRLKNAAPSLLAALEAVTPLIQEIVATHIDKGVTLADSQWDSVANAYAAIAQAKGEA